MGIDSIGDVVAAALSIGAVAGVLLFIAWLFS